MGYKISVEKMDEILKELSGQYKVFGPKWDRPHKNVRFAQLKSIGEIVMDRQSNFSIKEVFYPISQVMFYFKGEEVEPSEVADDRDLLIFARACDINSIKRLDKIFLDNGENNSDYFYARMRKKVKFALIECGGFENCFCVSTNSNETDDYAFAVKIADEILVEAKDEAFAGLFDKAGESIDYKPEFVKENAKKVIVPEIKKENLKAVSELEYWKKFDDKCIACGGCNTVCGTCSCFDTVDVVYSEGSSDGERKRVWSSCMLDSFTETAGGAKSRATHGANMRFKVFHKFYDFKSRFGTDWNMCVGCGRCEMRCPQEISFIDTVNELAEECKNI